MKMKTLLVGLLFAAIFFQVFMVLILGRRTPLGFGSTASVSSNEVVVPDNFTTIQAAINAANPGDTILVRNGTYLELDIVVNKSLTIVGENAQNTTIDGAGIAREIFQVSSSNVVIENFTLQNTDKGFSVQGPAIRIFNATNVMVKNVIARNVFNGLEITSSSFSKITNCQILDNMNSGIFLRLGSSNNTFAGNIIKNNSYGVYMQFTEQFNKVYRNNFINNTIQIEDFGFPNYFDNGYPSGGNYWSDHVASDLNYNASQDVPGSDGIFDEGYYEDRYPLVNPVTHFHILAESQTFLVDVSTNVTATECSLNVSGKSVSFLAGGLPGDQVVCRVAVPKTMLFCGNLADWTVTVFDSGSGQAISCLPLEDGESTYLYFTYNQTAPTVQIEMKGTVVIPEFPSAHIILLSGLVVFAATGLLGKRLASWRKLNGYRLTPIM